MLYGTSNPSQDSRKRTELWYDIVHSKGQTFDSVEHLRTDLTKFAISRGFDFYYIKNDSTRLTVKCKNITCTWNLHAIRVGLGPHFEIKTLNNNHTCGGGLSTQKHPRASKKWVSSIVKEKISDSPLYKPRDIKKDIFRDYGIDIPYHQAWHGKEFAYKELHGDDRCSFDALRWYVDVVQSTNPNSILQLDVSNDGRFERFFSSFHACALGFNAGCRPLLFLDGTFLKDKYKGILLSATAINGENEIFPLAYAICNAENESNWEWFLSRLKQVVLENRKLTFISDRCKGLIEAIACVYPESHHAYCLRHLKANFSTQVAGKYRGQIKKKLLTLFDQAAYSYRVEDHEVALQTMRGIAPDAEIWARNSNPNHWANAFFMGERYGEMYSNVAESFNAWILEARNLPIHVMVDHIRIQIMDLSYRRRNVCVAWETKLCPSIDARMRKMMEQSRGIHVNCSDGIVFEVCTRPSCVVNMLEGSCTCREWQVLRLPCKHACAVIHKIGGNVEDYCSLYFTSDVYRKCYEETIQPISDIDKPEADPDNLEVRPPQTKRRPGRRKKNRIPSQQSLEPEKMVYLCGRCKQPGHNRKSCSNPIAE